MCFLEFSWEIIAPLVIRVVFIMDFEMEVSGCVVTKFKAEVCWDLCLLGRGPICWSGTICMCVAGGVVQSV